MKIIILAGGFATRLWPITEKRAKPLLILKNQEIISHIVEKIPEENEIIISTNRVFEKDFLDWKKKYSKKNIEIFIEDSENDTWKKWALKAVSMVLEEKNIEKDFVVIAWDNYFWFDFKKVFEKFGENPLVIWFDLKEKEKAKSFWVINSKDLKKVDFFEEKPEKPKSSLISTGFYFFPKRFRKDIFIYSEKNNDNLWWIFEYFLSKKQEVNLFIFDSFWFDIWSFSGYLEANNILQKNKFIWENSEIENSEIDKKTFIWENCKIKNCKIENSIIFWNFKSENAEISNCIIDKNCKIENIFLENKIIRENSEISA